MTPADLSADLGDEMPPDSAAGRHEVSHCEVADCERPAVGRGLCETHYKRSRRGKSLGDPIQERLSPFDRLLRACNDAANAVDQDDRTYQLAIYRLQKAVYRYM